MTFPSPAVEGGGPQSFLKLVLSPFAGLHVQIFKDVELSFGADLGGGHLEGVVVKDDVLEMTEMTVAHRHLGYAVARHIQTDKGQL